MKNTRSRARACSSKSLSADFHATTENIQGQGESSAGPQRKRKKVTPCSIPSSSIEVDLSPVSPPLELSPPPPPPTLSNEVYSEGGENSELECKICTKTMERPTIILCCGHTYCESCIKLQITNNSVCPICKTLVTTDDICPNYAMNYLIKFQTEQNQNRCILPNDDIILEDLEAGPAILNMSLNDLDKTILVLQRRRDIMALNQTQFSQKLLKTFLSQLVKSKQTMVDKFNMEIEKIQRDLEVVESTESYNRNQPSCSRQAYFEPFVDTESPNYQGRLQLLELNFPQLTKLYFDIGNFSTSNSSSPDEADATVPEPVNSDFVNNNKSIQQFSQVLTSITKYHRFKQVASFCSDPDLHLQLSFINTNTNIVASIEFDKDNELFAIAGVTKKIKVYEYGNVVGKLDSDVHCHTVELSGDAKISCLAWNKYYKNTLATSDYDGNILVWDVYACTQLRSFNEHQLRAWSVDWSNTSPHLLASGSDDSTVKLWSSNQENFVGNIKATSNVCCVKFSPSKPVVAFGCADHCVYNYDIRNLKKSLGILYGHSKTVSYIEFISDQELVSASIDSSLKLWSLDDSVSSRSFQGHANVKDFTGLAVSGDYICCGSEDNSLYFYDKYLSQPLFSFKFENLQNILFEEDDFYRSRSFVSAVTWKKDAPVVLAANSGGIIKILQLD